MRQVSKKKPSVSEEECHDVLRSVKFKSVYKGYRKWTQRYIRNLRGLFILPGVSKKLLKK